MKGVPHHLLGCIGLEEETWTVGKFVGEALSISVTGSPLDQTRGIWVSIGYKEFLEYQDAQSNNSPSEPELEKLKTAAIEKTQAATRQYANRQIKWIRIKLLHALLSTGSKPTTFLVDGSDLAAWHTNVIEPATTITQRFLANQPLPEPSSLSAAAAEMLTPKREYDLGQRPDLWQKRVCETCGTVAVTENDWALHVRSRAHRRAVGVEKKREREKGGGGGVREKRLRDAQGDVVGVLEEYLASFPGERD
ncbi:tRNA isopentenyltransferase, mitochondrial precursor [Pyrenophora tritici-repentis Pt-1C-BFP]|uniref:tRNA isopentenyltransferase, mitochondrial n=1 Tax=Pyrenophora tritici-repentis (strain Pt-1C-BFP) TaxID=426418 RepID=B2WIE7_PYRTR|nr:tRNA isopentenyltransferase, mitochondrial precursor [Pyrenophora tritici-repentis Pt-1C-BFP]EDU42807.1 tRNA isopentenyltransferase, mitochondrial precursor [Pyrenophora tritici-repentis Pt-1C-BFP]